MQLILLSAGKGSRLPKNLRKAPKCLVKINSKSLLEYNQKFFKKFKNKIAICGYKQNKLKEVTKQYGFRNITNKKYSSTNMVYSLFLSRKFVDDDVVAIYGDIIFNKNIYSLLKPKKDILPVNKNWLQNWTNRMSIKKVLEDAEELKIHKKKITEIGTKIKKNNYPKYQFMGILKLKKKSFIKCFRYFKSLNNNKIEMTTFINSCIKNKIIKPYAKVYKSYWFEIDNINDYKYAKQEMLEW